MHRPKKINIRTNESNDGQPLLLIIQRSLQTSITCLSYYYRPALPNLRIQLFNSSCLHNKAQNRLRLGIFGHSKVLYHSVYQLEKFWEVLRLRLSTSRYPVGMWMLTNIQHALSTQFIRPCTYVYGIRMQYKWRECSTANAN